MSRSRHAIAEASTLALPGAHRALTFRAPDRSHLVGARLKLNGRQWRLYDPVNMTARGWMRGRRAD
jgi:hypothetical protein